MSFLKQLDTNVYQFNLTFKIRFFLSDIPKQSSKISPCSLRMSFLLQFNHLDLFYFVFIPVLFLS